MRKSYKTSKSDGKRPQSSNHSLAVFCAMVTFEGVAVRNEPNVHEAKMLDNADRWHGSDLSVTILGNWQYYRAKIIKYLRQIAVITPYSQFTFTFKSEDASNNIHVVFARRTEKMPEPPKVNPESLTKLVCTALTCQICLERVIKDTASLSLMFI